MAYPDFSDSSSSEYTKPQTWSSFTDSDESIYLNPPLPPDPEPPALSSSSINSHGSWSPCPAWSTSDWSTSPSCSTSDWSPCPAWSLSQNGSDHPLDDVEDASIYSHSSNQSDQDYVPASTFNPPITTPNHQSQSETQISDNIIEPSQAIRMLLCLLFKLANQFLIQESLAIHLANSRLWMAAYHNLETLKPECLIKPQALDFFLSWQSYQSQHSTNFYHLNIETIQKFTGDSNHDRTIVKNCFDSNNQQIKHAPVTFLICLGQNVYYLVLFDFSVNKTLILGRSGPVTMDIVTINLEWETWDGPILWKRIGQAFNWIDETRPMPVIYEANWIPVNICIIFL
jgi:hypothetical protein